jgi:hypothetical protein
MSGFGSLSTVVVVVFPPLRPASEALVRSLAKFPEFEFLELGMILYLLVMIVASRCPPNIENFLADKGLEKLQLPRRTAPSD